MKSDGTSLYYHSDHLGSSNVITDETGNKAATYEYQPYGKTSQQTGPDLAKHKFTGKELDTSTGLYFYGARYYDPELGRFITADPTIQHSYDPQDLNRYSYCRNNPIRYTDPTGLGWFKKFFGKVLGLFAGIVATIASGGNLWAGFQVFSFVNSAVTSIQTGNIGSFVGGIAGALVFGGIGKSLFLAMAARMGQSAFSFAGGFIQGAVEFGMGGFGAGFGAALGGGADIGTALKAGAITGGVAAAIGGVIQGSYMAGWQSRLHGNTREEVLNRQILTRGRAPTPREIQALRRIFPNLRDFRITGGPTAEYNCIAWTLGKTDEWINPASTIEGMDTLYGSYGYVVVPESQAEIALFVKHGVPQHGSLKISSDWYESKIGRSYRIIHRLREIEGTTYGTVERFYASQ